MVKLENNHRARASTPFADQAIHDSKAAFRLRLCLAHGIKDAQRDVLTVDDELFKQLLQNRLSPAAYLAAMEQLSTMNIPEEIQTLTVKNPRMSKWLPD